MAKKKYRYQLAIDSLLEVKKNMEICLAEVIYTYKQINCKSGWYVWHVRQEIKQIDNAIRSLKKHG